MQTPAQTFRSLLVWQKAHAFVLAVYKLTETFPKHELYGLTSQLRRAAVSIPANIAEGFRKRSLAEKARFYNIAQGSLEECRYYLILVQDLHYSDSTLLESQLDEVARLLYRYIANLGKTTSTAAPTPSKLLTPVS
jgi:four helix bundle protein